MRHDYGSAAIYCDYNFDDEDAARGDDEVEDCRCCYE